MNINTLLHNKNFTIIASILLAAYVGLINTDMMPFNLVSMVNTTIGKVVILVLIAYLGDKTPTVALTKSRLAQPVPMPMIIAAVSQYKNNPDSINNFIKTSQQPENTELKASQLDRIEQKLDQLLALLEQK